MKLKFETKKEIILMREERNPLSHVTYILKRELSKVYKDLKLSLHLFNEFTK